MHHTQTHTDIDTKKQHKGIVVPMVTPFTSQGELDQAAIGRLVDFMIEGGVSGIFVLGTTGEAASMPLRMRCELVRTTVDCVKGRALVYAGIGNNCMSDSIEIASASLELGANALVAHLASYYSLNATEMFDYYALLAKRIKGPLVLYNIPATTRMSIPVETIARLSKLPQIVALKDSENDVNRMGHVVDALSNRSDFSLLMGSSSLAGKALLMGMDGAVPGFANLCPELCRDLYLAAKRKDFEAVERSQSHLNGVAKVLQQERTVGQAVAALKAAMNLQGLCEPTVLPPLTSMNHEQMEEIEEGLAAVFESV